MAILPESNVLEILSEDIKLKYPEIRGYFKDFSKVDKNLSLLDKKIVEGQAQKSRDILTEFTSDLALAVLCLAKENGASIREVLRFLIIGIVMGMAGVSQESEYFLEQIIYSIFNLFASWYDVEDLCALSKAVRRGKGQAFRYFDRAGVERFGKMRLGIGQGIGSGLTKSLEGLPIFGESKLKILQSANIWDFYYGYYVDYILNGFWP